MKLKFETRVAAIGGASMPGFGGWRVYSTRAETKDGLLRAMRAQAEKSLERRWAFYQNNAAARAMDKFDLKHVWHFHTYAPFGSGTLRYDAFAISTQEGYSQMEETWAIYGLGIESENWDEFSKVKRKYETLCSAA